MYYYIVNPAAGNGGINDIQQNLKSTLHQLQIDGKFSKTLGAADVSRMTSEAVESGATTVVAVGGDSTVRQVIRTLYKHKDKNVALGIIPIGKNNLIAGRLGINNWKDACNILATRRLNEYYLLRCNREFFIFGASFVMPEANIESANPAASRSMEFNVSIDGTYQIKGQSHLIKILNQKFLDYKLANQLTLQIDHAAPGATNQIGRWWHKIFGGTGVGALYSQLPAQKLVLEFETEVQASLDGKTKINTRFELGLSQRPLSLITARSNVE